MRVNFILPSLEEASGKYWRSIKYSLFPPLGLALLAGYLDEDDEAVIIDEHICSNSYNNLPDLVAIEVYVTNAYRAYDIADKYRAKGVYVVFGGLHATACQEEAASHCDTLITGPAEEAWPRFLTDFRKSNPKKHYKSTIRHLESQPHIRRDLIDRHLYLIPNSIVVSRGCTFNCDFCYKDNFYDGGKSFYTAPLKWIEEELDAMPGRYVFFLDDNIMADNKFALELFQLLESRNKIWQGASDIQSLKDEALLEAAVNSGLKSLFIGFESINEASLEAHNKRQNCFSEYTQIIRSLHDRGVMINASFVFGMEDDTKNVFEHTVDWAVNNGLETATFHLLTPHPGSSIYNKYLAANKIISHDWSLYDTRHAVYKHPNITKKELEEGYEYAYKKFYSWPSIFRAAASKKEVTKKIRHFIYTTCWKKFDFIWKTVIALKRLSYATSMFERFLR